MNSNRLKVTYSATKLTWRGRGLSKSFISRLIIGVTPFRVLIPAPITYLLSPLPLQVDLVTYTLTALTSSLEGSRVLHGSTRAASALP